MIKEIALATKLETAAETLLCRGVIARTIEDCLSTHLRPKREPERYLFEDSANLSLFCSSAGISVFNLRT
jgi:hypothetical protein